MCVCNNKILQKIKRKCLNINFIKHLNVHKLK